MKRRVLAIPREEIENHLAENARQDIKIVAPKIMSDELFQFLLAKGKQVKSEKPLDGDIWKHSKAEEPNRLCESGDFVDNCLPQYVPGPFSISFANEKAEQDEHFHKYHFEMYYSQYRMNAQFRYLESEQCEPPIELNNGGLIVFGPNVVHRMSLGGLTIVIEVASMEDKTNEKLNKL